MKAVQMTAVGSPEVLRFVEIDEPKIQRDSQIKVQLKAAGVNPIDTKLRRRGMFYPDALPSVLGCDGAGIVVETGRAVLRFKPGDEVWFFNGGIGGEQGNYAEFTIVDASVAQRKPSSLSFTEAAAVPLALITAWESLYDRAQLKRGDTVLIHAGAGGVGHLAIQLARNSGAHICTTVGTEEKAEFVTSLGASEAILYREHDFVEAVKAWSDGLGVDVGLDTVGGETFRRTLSAIAHYGEIVTLLDPGKDIDWKEARNRNLRIGFELVLTPLLKDLPRARQHQVEILEHCGRMFDEARLKVHVGRTFPLREVAQAHKLIEEGHVQGKIVITMEN